jgi:glutamate N-acetyltransferase/amino-acid N-acetyltransferase
VFGGDTNPGRFLQAAGAAGVALDASGLDVSVGDVPVAVGGVIPPEYFEPGSALAERAAAAMQETEIAVRVRLGDGPGASRAYGCDLSYEYVRINGEYTT